MSCLEFLGCLLHFMESLSAERNCLSKGVHAAPSPTPSTPLLSLLYVFQIHECVCRRVNLEVFIPHGLPRKFRPTPKCARTVASACGVWCVCACVCVRVCPHPHTPPHTVFFCLPPSLPLSLSVIPTLPLLSLSLSHVCTHILIQQEENICIWGMSSL